MFFLFAVVRLIFALVLEFLWQQDWILSIFFELSVFPYASLDISKIHFRLFSNLFIPYFILEGVLFLHIRGLVTVRLSLKAQHGKLFESTSDLTEVMIVILFILGRVECVQESVSGNAVRLSTQVDHVLSIDSSHVLVLLCKGCLGRIGIWAWPIFSFIHGHVSSHWDSVHLRSHYIIVPALLSLKDLVKHLLFAIESPADFASDLWERKFALNLRLYLPPLNVVKIVGFFGIWHFEYVCHREELRVVMFISSWDHNVSLTWSSRLFLGEQKRRMVRHTYLSRMTHEVHDTLLVVWIRNFIFD